MGFARIYVEKLRHLRCLAFVKVGEDLTEVCIDAASNLCRKLGLRLDQE
jgi:hypothetical protein